MKVLFVNENIGGHATAHMHLKRALRDHPDVDPAFLDVPSPRGLRRLLGARVPGLATWDADLQPLRAQLLLSQWVRARMRRTMHEFDVVHVYTGNAALGSARLLAQMPSVVTTDATNATNGYRLPTRRPSIVTPLGIRLTQRFERPVYRHCTIVVANSRWVADSMRDDYGVPASKLRAFPLGIAVPAEALKASKMPPSDPPRLVFVGRQLERKGALKLIAAHQRHLADECELVIISPEPIPRGKNLRSVSDITPGSGKLWDELGGASAFVFPSTIDHSPNAVMEALASGLPVIGHAVNAMPELVPPSAGILTSPGDEAALVDAIRRVIHQPEVRSSLARGARHHFAANYDAAVSTARLVDTFDEARALFASSPGR